MTSSTVTHPTSHNMPSHPQENSAYLFSYSKSMYEYTREQMKAADQSARKRSANSKGRNAHAGFRTRTYSDSTTLVGSPGGRSTTSSRLE
ncbi:hypothetical protein NHQ30_001119 [Ciborinia camelliae]|nr:hypothetical protein NHQ30_001119 [Ciborinia camelliae]